VLAVLALGGCGTGTRIEAEDNRVFLPSVRASYNFAKGNEASSESQDGQAIEVGMSRARGSGSQVLAAGQSPVFLEGKTFNGPEQLKNEFDFSFTNVSWRLRKSLQDRPMAWEVLLGAGYSRLGLAVSSSTQRAFEHFSTLGPHGGVGVIWRVHPTTSVQARYTRFFTVSDGVNEVDQGELFLAKALHENLIVRAGYAGWRAKGQVLLSSDFRLRFSGPALGLELSFGP
jgi:hypothetical protein